MTVALHTEYAVYTCVDWHEDYFRFGRDREKDLMMGH